MMRLFIGIGLPRDARDALCHAVSGLGIRGRLSAPENYHLTLAFLGEHGEDLRPLEGVLKAAARTCAPFRLSVAGLGYFSRRDSALLHAKLAYSRPLQTLSGDLRALLTETGEPFDSKPFAAHITLARQADLTMANLQTPLPCAAFPADRLTLFHSARVQGALRYTPVFEALFEKEEFPA